jgi:proteic killer suppression protein
MSVTRVTWGEYRSSHDEPLKGDRQGQRSVRLNRAYRAIYVEREDDEVALVDVIEVNKHGY